jgi:DNA primase
VPHEVEFVPGRLAKPPVADLEDSRAGQCRHQPRPGLLPGARVDQARPGHLLPRVGDGHRRALRERPCMLHRFPDGLAGEKVHQKRLPRGAAVGRDRASSCCTSRGGTGTADELCVTELAVGHLGGADVDGRVPPVEQPPRRRRPARRVAHRPRPDAGVRLPRVRRVAHVAHEVLDELGASATPKTSGGNGLHVYVRIEPEWGFADVRRAALAFAARSSGRCPTT